jgi:hypothetical protein
MTRQFAVNELNRSLNERNLPGPSEQTTFKGGMINILMELFGHLVSRSENVESRNV